MNKGGPDVAEYLRPLEEREVKREYRKAQDTLDQMPSKYAGVSTEEAEAIDDFVYDEVPAERMKRIQAGEDVSERDVAQILATRKNDSGLYAWYDALKSERRREALLNPDFDTWRLQHMEELERWFPWLFDDIGFYRRSGLLPEETGRARRPTRPERTPVATP